MLRLSVFILFAALSSQASALTFKSGESIGQNTSDNDNQVIIFDSDEFELPDSIKFQPNDATLWHYYNKVIDQRFRVDKHYRVMPDGEVMQLNYNLSNNSYLNEQLTKTSLMSYLFWERGSIVFDEISPKERFNGELAKSAYFPSHSMGKSLTSYLIGHAICDGYIASIDEPISDWKLMESTLYYGQPLIDLLNMRAGDTNVIRRWEARYTNTGRHIHNIPLALAAENNEELKNTKPVANAKWSYSNLTSDVLTSYLMHRVGHDYEQFLTNIFQKKIGIERPIYFSFSPTKRGGFLPTMLERIKDGAGEYSYIASRYDFLRVAIAMLSDWKNNTCVGQYLKEIHKRRIPTRRNAKWNRSRAGKGFNSFSQASKSYGGQFWMDIVGLENEEIFIMTGYNGQQIGIDMKNERIVVMHAAKSKHYSTKRLGFDVLKNGNLD